MLAMKASFYASSIDQNAWQLPYHDRLTNDKAPEIMLRTLSGPLVLAGAGRMGGALLSCLLKRGLDPSLVRVQDPQPSPDTIEFLNQFGIKAEPILLATDVSPALIIVAVKPQVIDEVWPALAKLSGPGTVTLSVVAGRKLESFERVLPTGSAVVRAMPNTPVAIGKGMTVCCPNENVTNEQKELCTKILTSAGEIAWISDESEMDAVTAVSGSGPAYIFHLTECLKEAGVEAGLSEHLADRLARETVVGSGALLAQSKQDPATLRINVTSPGGTTEAALKVLRDDNALRDLMIKAVAAAKKRSKELSD